MEIDIDVKAPLGSEIACGQADPTKTLTCTASYKFATSVDGSTQVKNLLPADDAEDTTD